MKILKSEYIKSYSRSTSKKAVFVERFNNNPWSTDWTSFEKKKANRIHERSKNSKTISILFSFRQNWQNTKHQKVLGKKCTTKLEQFWNEWKIRIVHIVTSSRIRYTFLWRRRFETELRIIYNYKVFRWYNCKLLSRIVSWKSEENLSDQTILTRT